jgi:serine/threonine protein kinase
VKGIEILQVFAE